MNSNMACELGSINTVQRKRGEIKKYYFMLSGRTSSNIGENIFRSYTGTTSENTDFHVVAA